MPNLFAHLDLEVYARYTRSLENSDFREEFMRSTAHWRKPAMLGRLASQKAVCKHRVDLDSRIILGAEPSQAPFLIRHYLDEGLECLRFISSAWDLTVLDGSMEELFGIAPKYIALAERSAQLGFYCASREIDPLQSYALEYKYDTQFYQHVLRTQRVAYASDVQQYRSGKLDYVDYTNYSAACRDITFLCANNLIESLTKARDDLSGCIVMG
jgi:hypothetical protein